MEEPWLDLIFKYSFSLFLNMLVSFPHLPYFYTFIYLLNLKFQVNTKLELDNYLYTCKYGRIV